MQSWVIPFIYLAIVLAVYLFAPRERRAEIQGRIRKDINFYIILDLVLIVVSVISTVYSRQTWLRWIDCVLLFILSVIAIRKALTPPQVEPEAEDVLNQKNVRR